MNTPDLFPGEAALREMAVEAGWSPSTGNGFATIFVSPHNENVTLRAYASFYEEGVTPAYLIVETLEGDPERGPVGLQVWVSTRSGRVPAPRRRWGCSTSKAWCAGWATSCPRTGRSRWRGRGRASSCSLASSARTSPGSGRAGS